jgi:DNA recombination protein RmuC
MDNLIMILGIISIVLLCIILVLLIYNIKKRDNSFNSELKDMIKDENYKLNSSISDENAELRVKIAEAIAKSQKDSMQDLGVFKDGLNKQITESVSALSRTLNEQMSRINEKVEFRLTEGFKQANQTFQNIVERLTKIDIAQKNIEKLSSEVVDLQHLLTDKKSRGAFGEVQLNNILESIFGDSNKRTFETQTALSNGKIVDALLHIPPPMGDLAIDSKFPLENYRKMMDHNLNELQRLEATKNFKSDLKKHVDDIASKYIIVGETADQAVMFLPAEAIFAEINAYHQDLIEYAQRKRVWIASPTTIMSFLTTVQVLLQNIERDKNAKIIQEELIKLGDEFARYQVRWEKLQRSIKTVSEDVERINITSGKITKRFDEIVSVEIENNDKIE